MRTIFLHTLSTLITMLLFFVSVSYVHAQNPQNYTCAEGLTDGQTCAAGTGMGICNSVGQCITGTEGGEIDPVPPGTGGTTGGNGYPTTGGTTGGNGYPTTGGTTGGTTGTVFPNILQDRFGNLCQLLNGFINIVTEIGAIVAVLFIIWSGFLFVKSQGNSEEIKKAKTVFYNTIIGTALLLGASVITKIIVNTIMSITKSGGSGGIC